jgi:rhodanese-related sulfurtransferase
MMTTATESACKIVDVEPALLETWLARGDTLLVDVREDFEHAEERIPGARPAPLSRLDPAALRASCNGSTIVFHCRSGKRSTEAATRFAGPGETVFQLAGGIEAWKASGREVLRPAKAGLPIMRQVQIAAGSMVVLGVGLGVAVSPWFLALAAFVGCGLMFAGVSGWCGLAMLLGRMPWNKRAGASCAPTCCAG